MPALPSYLLDRPLRVVRYLRVSTLMQSPRSPEQQREEIDRTVSRLAKPWEVVGEYCDRGISGRFVARRPGLRQLLADIETGTLKIEAVLVDTYERWGRHDEMRVLRRSLWNEHRVFLLTADSGFSDPTTEAGRALAFLEQVRATSANAIRAHDIYRGKADAVRQKHWPGGSPPFGYRILRHLQENGRECRYTTLDVDTQTAPVVRKVFQWAADRGAGRLRLARLFNEDPDIPQAHKPIRARTLEKWLDNPIYYGQMIWGRVSHDIVEDVCITRPNPPEEHVTVEDFCPAIIERDLFERVRTVRQARRETTIARYHECESSNAAAPVPGKSQHCRLAALVCCGSCGRRMKVCGGSSGGPRICYYYCGAHLEGGCSNGTRVREDSLWAEVELRLRRHLGLAPTGDNDLSQLPAPLAAFADQVRAYALGSQEDVAPKVKAVEKRLAQLTARMDGWVQSLGRPGISAALRQRLAAEYTRAKEDSDKIRLELGRLHATSDELQRALEPAEALKRIKRLAELLTGCNLAALNVELHSYIDRISVAGNGGIELRTTGLGAFRAAIGCLARIDGEGNADAQSPAEVMERRGRPVKLRRRSARWFDQAQESDVSPEDRTSVDPRRFEGVCSRWFQTETFAIRRTQSRCRKLAPEVTALRTADPHRWTVQRLAEHFNVSDSTICAAIRVSAGLSPLYRGERTYLPTLTLDTAQIRQRRLAAGLSRAGVAALMSRCVKCYRQIETGQRTRETPERVDKLAAALGCGRNNLVRAQPLAPTSASFSNSRPRRWASRPLTQANFD